MQINDADGYVMQDSGTIVKLMPAEYQKVNRFRGQIYPPLDHLHFGTLYRVELSSQPMFKIG